MTDDYRAAYAADPIFPDQTCRGCGIEHPGMPCELQDDLFGDAIAPLWAGKILPIEAAPGPVLETPEVPRGLALDPIAPERTHHPC